MKLKNTLRCFIVVFIVALAAVLSIGISAASDDKIVIVLDPGHGGNDPGTTVGTRYESEYNYDIAILLKEKLEKTGNFQVYMSRGRNEKPVYLLRAYVAEQYNADILISLHFNSNPTLDPTLNGVEVLASVLDEWCPTTLANSICASISGKCGLSNGGIVRKEDTGDERGVYYWNNELGWDIPGVKTDRVSDYYSMIAWGTKLGFPSIIVEHAYLSNKSDLAFCDSEDGLEKMAEAEADAIIKYFTGHTHTYGAETCDRRANCCLEGVYSRKCTICGHRTDVRRTPKVPDAHGWISESKEATCIDDGYLNRECQISRNLSEKGFDHISVHNENVVYLATGHTNMTEIDTPAGHAVDGLLRQVCLTCGGVTETVRPGDPHIYVTRDSVPASCTAAGYDKYECTVCHDEYVDEYPALGHAYESDGEKLTCASDGTKVYSCKVCGDVMAENVVIPPHTIEVVENTAPTCTEDGTKREKCQVCGLENELILPALGHDYSEEGEKRLSPTYFADGEIVYVCKNNAEHLKIEAIPKKPGGVYIVIAIIAVGVIIPVAAVLIIMSLRAAVDADEDEEMIERLEYGYYGGPAEDNGVTETEDEKTEKTDETKV